MGKPTARRLDFWSSEGYVFDHIPDIFSWPHRKMMSLEARECRQIMLDDDTLHKISEFIVQEFKIRMIEDGKDHFQQFKDEIEDFVETGSRRNAVCHR